MEMAASPAARMSLRGAKIAQTRSSAPRRKKNHMWVKDPSALTRTSGSEARLGKCPDGPPRPRLSKVPSDLFLDGASTPPVPGGESVRIQRRKKKIDSAATKPIRL